jgi:hypothetical protein
LTPNMANFLASSSPTPFTSVIGLVSSIFYRV